MSTFAAVVIEAKKDGLRQTQDGLWKLTLAVHPNDDLAWLLNAPIGQRLGLTVAALKDEIAESSSQGQPSSGDAVSPTVSSANLPKRKWEEMPLSQRAALRCHDVAFIDWLRAQDSEHAADMVRRRCAVHSRSELDTNPEAAAKWFQLDARFLTETGRQPERRG